MGKMLNYFVLGEYQVYQYTPKGKWHANTRTFCCAGRHWLHPHHTAKEKSTVHCVQNRVFHFCYVQLARIQSHTHLTSKEAGKHSLLSAQEKQNIYLDDQLAVCVFHGYLLLSRFHSSTVLIIISLLYFETKEKW